jgi:hypothetical protein
MSSMLLHQKKVLKVPNLIQLQLVIRNQRKLKKKLLLDVKN